MIWMTCENGAGQRTPVAWAFLSPAMAALAKTLWKTEDRNRTAGASFAKFVTLFAT
jgi:hypothetical protein